MVQGESTVLLKTLIYSTSTEEIAVQAHKSSPSMVLAELLETFWVVLCKVLQGLQVAPSSRSQRGFSTRLTC